MQTENILEALTLSFDYIDVVAELRRFPENSASPEYNNGLRSYDKTFGQTDVSHSNGSLSHWSVGEILGVPRRGGSGHSLQGDQPFPNPYDIRRLFAAVPHAATGKKIEHFRWKYSNQRSPHPNEPGADCAPEDYYGAINDSDGAVWVWARVRYNNVTVRGLCVRFMSSMAGICLPTKFNITLIIETVIIS